jgi:hypothetical protein
MDQPSKGEQKDLQDVLTQEVYTVLGQGGGGWYIEKFGDRSLEVGDEPSVGDQQSNSFELCLNHGYDDEELGQQRPVGGMLSSGYRDVLRVRVEFVRREPLP